MKHAKLNTKYRSGACTIDSWHNEISLLKREVKNIFLFAAGSNRKKFPIQAVRREQGFFCLTTLVIDTWGVEAC